jgi:hypothetical protein
VRLSKFIHIIQNTKLRIYNLIWLPCQILFSHKRKEGRLFLLKMSPPQFVIEDDETSDQAALTSPQQRYSEDSIDETALNRQFFEKDARFRDEVKMEQGGEEEDDEFLYSRTPVSLVGVHEAVMIESD